MVVTPGVDAAGSSDSGSTVSSNTKPKGVESVNSFYSKAEKLIKAKDWEGAIVTLEKSLSLNSNHADSENLMGYSYRKLGNYDRAFMHYARALELNPKHLGAHEYIGEAYLKVQNLKGAKKHLGRLGNLCAYDCPEYRDLRKKIISFEKAQKSKAG